MNEHLKKSIFNYNAGSDFMHKRSFILLLLFIIAITVFSIFAYDAEAKSYVKSEENKSTKKLILIDPGHGGKDGGAVSKNGTVEKNINLIIASKLKECLLKSGYDVLMTRENDVMLKDEENKNASCKKQDMGKRCKIKAESGCDLFISIHLNMFPISKYSGAQVWYSKNPYSKVLGELVQKNLINDIDKTNNRLAKAANNDYKVLRCCDNIPSILVECGFLSNASEESKLKSDEYQQKIAEILNKSIAEYFKG